MLEPPGSPTARSLHRARIAVATMFLVNGMLFGDWVPRIPMIKDRVHAGTGPLGLALLGIAVGALLTKPSAGRLVARYGSGPVTRVGITLSCAALVLPALAVNVPTLALCLLGFGGAMGVNDVAMNAHGVRVQRLMGRSILSSCHGVYSVGGVLGALIGGRAAALGISPLVHFGVAAAALGVLALAASRWLLPPEGESPGGAAVAAEGRAGLGRDRLVLLYLLGAIGLCGMVGEGAVGDWGAVYLQNNLGSGAEFASTGYVAYSVAMAVGRLGGDRFISRWGGPRVAAVATAFGGAGLAAGLSAGRPVAAVAGFAVLGLGLSVVNPVAYSLAGTVGGDEAGPALAVVSGVGGCGMLAGPPVIGFIAEGVGLPTALGTVSVLAFLNVLLISVAGRRVRVPAAAPVPAESAS